MKNIIFDMDGTILDSEKLYFDILSRTASKFGVMLSKEQYRDYYSTDLFTKASKIIREYSLSIKEEEFVIEYRRIQPTVTENYGKKLLFEDTKYTLNYLKENGYHLYLCTNSRSEHVKKMLEIIGLDDIFEGMVCREMCDKFKPDPEPYQKVIETYKLNKEATCAVEDSSHGVKSAKLAGLYTIGVVRELPIDERYTDVQVRSLKEIIELLR